MTRRGIPWPTFSVHPCQGFLADYSWCWNWLFFVFLFEIFLLPLQPVRVSRDLKCLQTKFTFTFSRIQNLALGFFHPHKDLSTWKPPLFTATAVTVTGHRRCVGAAVSRPRTKLQWLTARSSPCCVYRVFLCQPLGCYQKAHYLIYMSLYFIISVFIPVVFCTPMILLARYHANIT